MMGLHLENDGEAATSGYRAQRRSGVSKQVKPGSSMSISNGSSTGSSMTRLWRVWLAGSATAEYFD